MSRRPVLFAAAACIGGAAAIAPAHAGQCPFLGKAVVQAAAQLGGVNEVGPMVQPAPPAPPSTDDTVADQPPPRPPGICDIEIEEAASMAIAKADPFVCKATFMGRIRTIAPWRIVQVEVRGPSFVYIVRPARGGRKLDTVVKISAPPRKAKAATVMRVILEDGRSGDTCPRDVADLLERY